MNPKRLEKFTEAYAVALAALGRMNPEAYKVRADEQSEDKALRVALKTAWLIENFGLSAVFWTAASFRGACEALKIPHSEEGIQVYLDGGKT